MRNKPNCLNDLQAAGFNYEDACALRRIAMTLHRWHELECGDSNDYNSFCLVRGTLRRKRKLVEGLDVRIDTFDYDDNGKPYLEIHSNRDSRPTRYELQPDRERGALKRLAKIMARYPGFAHYVQTDPRGASLYILRPTDLNGSPLQTRSVLSPEVQNSEFREWLSANYSRGIAVFK